MPFQSRYIIIFLLLLLSTSARCQLNWESTEFFTTRSGLPNNSIITLFQDSKGYLWIGTYNGLCRYDGHEFKVYSHGPGVHKDWVFSVSAITEDKDGNILIGTRGGVVARLDRKTDKWQYMHIKGSDVTSILIDADQREWVTTRNGLIGKIEEGKIKITKAIGSQIRGMSLFTDNQFLIQADEAQIYDPVKNEVKKLASNYSIPYIVEEIYSASGLGYLFHKNNQVTVNEYGKTVFSTFKLPGELNYQLFRDPVSVVRGGHLITITDKGLFEISNNGKIMSRIELDPQPQELNRNFVNVIFKDNTGLIWIGTNAGLFKIDKKKFAFKKFTSNSTEYPIKHNYVRSLYSEGNELWVGTRFGEIGKLLIDTSNKHIYSQQWYGVEIGDAIERNYTTNTLVGGPNGIIWAGGNRGLLVLNKGGRDFKQIRFSEKGDTNAINDIWALCPINNEKLLIGTVNTGLFLMNVQDNTLKWCYIKGRSRDISVWNIYRSTDGTVWVGTGNGVYVYNENSNKLLPLEAEGSARMRNIDIWSITEDKAGSMWFGSTNEGVFYLKKGGSVVYQLSEKDGLCDNVTSGIVPDMEGNVWISTINGLSKFDIRQKRFFNFNEEDGLISNDFNFKSYTATSWGEVYFGTKVGIIAFKPRAVTNSGSPEAQVEISSFRVEGTEQPVTAEVKLDHNSNNVSFRFALLDFGKPLTHTYRYKLIGFDKNWQYTSATNPSATYTNLPPENYKFIAEASVDNRHWSKHAATMSIYVQPAFWQRPITWFGSGIIMLLASIMIVRRRIQFLVKREREKARVQKAMAELEMKALRAQMNPHFIFNAVTAIQHYIVKNDILQANEYLSKFARLMRSFLELSRYKYVTLAKEIELLELYISLEKLRFDERFEYIIDIDKSINTRNILIPSMLLQPFVENAINHGLVYKNEKGLLRVHFELGDNDKTLYCVIEDNGIGRKQAAKRNGNSGHVSLGTKIVEERVKSFLDTDDLKITVKVKDKYTGQGDADGTLVKVGIPLTQQTVLLE